jgi:hypothetical protein
MTVFAGVLAESHLSGNRDPWSAFGQQGDDVSKLQEIIDLEGFRNEDEGDRWQEQAWKQCEQLVTRRRAQILRVAEALLESGSLSGHEVRALMLPNGGSSRRTIAVILTLIALLVAVDVILTWAKRET